MLVLEHNEVVFGGAEREREREREREIDSLVSPNEKSMLSYCSLSLGVGFLILILE